MEKAGKSTRGMSSRTLQALQLSVNAGTQALTRVGEGGEKIRGGVEGVTYLTRAAHGVATDCVAVEVLLQPK